MHCEHHVRRNCNAAAAIVVAFATLFGSFASAAATLTDAIADVLNSDSITREWDADARLHGILRQHYAGRGYEPMWVSDSGVSDRGRQLAAVIADAEREGLNAPDYQPAAVSVRLSSTSVDGLARLDVLLSLQLAHYVGDVASGRLSPREYDSNIFAQPRDIDEAATLNKAAETVTSRNSWRRRSHTILCTGPCAKPC